MRSTCPAFRILGHFIAVLIFGEHNFLDTLCQYTRRSPPHAVL
jgi:hypothetical protein